MPMEYDPFARGPFPVGVRTRQVIDTTRHGRRLPFELWYPAAAPYAGHNGTTSTQDTFTVLPGSSPLRQAAVRDAAVHPGTYPLIVFSHSSHGHRAAVPLPDLGAAVHDCHTAAAGNRGSNQRRGFGCHGQRTSRWDWPCCRPLQRGWNSGWVGSVVCFRDLQRARP